MSAPARTTVCAMVSGDVFDDPQGSDGGAGRWDTWTEFVLVTGAAYTWRAAIKAKRAIGSAHASMAQMYVQGYRLQGLSGNWAEVAVQYKGRFDITDGKKTRRCSGNAWTASGENVTIGLIQAPLSQAPSGAPTKWTTWSRDGSGTEGPGPIEVTHGDLSLRDTWMDFDADPWDHFVNVGFQRTDTAPVEPSDSPPTPPRSPWQSLTEPLVSWPSGWILQNRERESIGGTPDQVPGTLHLLTDVWGFTHKYKL